MINELDKKIIAQIQGDIPVCRQPFSVLAENIGIGEDLFIDRVKALVANGAIRRFGATLYHRSAGIRANAMAAWYVPDDLIEEAGRTFAGFREVTHCYQRPHKKDWRYNLYTMIHGKSEEDCRAIAERMSEQVGIKDYRLLFSKKEFKKTSMEYF